MKTSDFRHARRAFLRRGATIAAAFPFLALPRKAAAADTLTLLAWYGNGEPDVVGAFEEANNVKIESKYYTGGDNMLALLAQSPTGTYDVILSDAEYVTQLRRADNLAKLDPDDYPFDDFFAEFRRFPVPGFWDGGDLYAVPLSFGFLGMTYNADIVSEKTARSYAGLWDSLGQRQGRPFRLAFAEFGLPQPVRRQPAPFRHRQRRFRQTAKNRAFSAPANQRVF